MARDRTTGQAPGAPSGLGLEERIGVESGERLREESREIRSASDGAELEWARRASGLERKGNGWTERGSEARNAAWAAPGACSLFFSFFFFFERDANDGWLDGQSCETTSRFENGVENGVGVGPKQNDLVGKAALRSAGARSRSITRPSTKAERPNQVARAWPSQAFDVPAERHGRYLWLHQIHTAVWPGLRYCSRYMYVVSYLRSLAGRCQHASTNRPWAAEKHGDCPVRFQTDPRPARGKRTVRRIGRIGGGT